MNLSSKPKEVDYINIQKAVQNFGQHLSSIGLAPKTIESYTNDVKGFLTFLLKHNLTEQANLQRFHFKRYMSHLKQNDYAISTINKKVNSLVAYNKWLIEKGILGHYFVFQKRDRINVAAGSEHRVETLADEEVTKLLFHIQSQSIRNRLIIYLLLYTGVRVSELVNIKRQDIDNLTSTLSITGKGGKYREIPLRAEVEKLIRDYITTQRAVKHQDSHFLLRSQRSPKLHRDAVSYMFIQLSIDMGIKLFCTQLGNSKEDRYD